MRRYAGFIPFLIFSSLLPAEPEGGGDCFPVSRKEIKPPNLNGISKVALSRNGGRLLYSVFETPESPMRTMADESPPIEREEAENLRAGIPEILREAVDLSENIAEYPPLETTFKPFEKAVYLLDLESLKREEFLSASDREEPDIFPSRQRYGFSPDGSFVYGIRSEGGFKIKYLSGDETAFSFLNGRRVFHIEPLKGEGLLIIDGSKKEWERFLDGETPDSPRRETQAGRGEAPTESLDPRPNIGGGLVLRVWDPVTLKQKKEKNLSLNPSLMTCYNVSASLNRFFYVERDGSLWGVPLKGTDDPEMWFGPEKGFKLSSGKEENCVFFGKSSVNILRLPENRGFLIRSLEEKRSFVRPAGPFFPYHHDASGRLPIADGVQLFRLSRSSLMINYPFSIQRESFVRIPGGEGVLRRRFRVYHIPEGRFMTMPEEVISFVTDGKNRLALQTKSGPDGLIFQAIFRPFDPARRKIVLEMPVREICQNTVRFSIEEFFNREESRAFVSSEWGDLFIIDVSTGEVQRLSDFFTGSCFKGVEVSSSGDTFVGWTPFFGEEDQGQPRLFRKIHTVHKFQKICGGDPARPEKQPVRFNLKAAGPNSRRGTEIPVDGISEFSSNETDILERAEEKEKSSESAPAYRQVLFSGEDGVSALESSFLRLFTVAVWKGNLVQERPEVLDELLWKILLQSPVLYLALHRKYPVLGDMPPSLIYGDFSSGLREKLRESASALFRTSRPTRFSRWRLLRRLQPLLRELPPEERDHYIDTITDSLSVGAGVAHPVLKEVFQSKLFYIIRGRVQELFGLPRHSTSDLTLVREKQSFQTVILASDPIVGPVSNVSTDFGLHYGPVPEAGRENLLSLTTGGGTLLTDHLVEWNLKGDSERSYRGKVHVRVKENVDESFLKPVAGPNYAAGYRDGQMTGAVIVGASLAPERKSLINEYLAYFYEQGFQFSTFEVEDMKSFLIDGISCEWDWLLKESHGGGDERNMLRFAQENHIIQADREEALGRRERVYLIVPKKSLLAVEPVSERNFVADDGTARIQGEDPVGQRRGYPYGNPPILQADAQVPTTAPTNGERESLDGNSATFRTDTTIQTEDQRGEEAAPLGVKETDILSNRELGQAVSQRSAQDCGQIIYFNTGCRTDKKARYEVEAVASPLFLNIPTLSLSYGFENRPKNALRALIHSFRQERDFKGFRQALKANEGYRLRTGDLYIFPDEEIYKNQIFEAVSIPMDIAVELFVRNGGPAAGWRKTEPDEVR